MVSTQPPACTADEISPAVTVVTTLPDFMHNVQYSTELLASFDSFTGMFDKSDGEITVPFLATSSYALRFQARLTVSPSCTSQARSQLLVISNYGNRLATRALVTSEAR